MSLNFPSPPQWTDEAACAEVDPSIFYPGDGARGTTAKRICAKCPMTEMCLEYALEHNDKYGVYGGLLPRERDRIKQNRTRRNNRAKDAA